MGSSLLLTQNINQALDKFQKVEQYYQKYGDNIFSPDKKDNYVSMLIGTGYCFLYKNEIEKARQILEEKLTPWQSVISEKIPSDSLSALQR